MNLVLYLTLVELCLGVSAIHCFVPRAALGMGWGKTISTIAFFCLLGPVLAAHILLPQAGGDGLTGIRVAGAAGLVVWFVYFVVLNYDRPKLERTLVVSGTLCATAMLILTCRHLTQYFYAIGSTEVIGPTQASLMLSLTLGTFSTAFLTGSVLMAMLVGHWYLVESGLPISWLKGACLAFGGAALIKVVAIGVSVVIGMISNPYGPQGFLDDFRVDSLLVLFFSVRLLVGIAIPLVFAVMAYRAAAMRATQSSTGILFPAIVVVFMGEMIGTYLISGLAGLCV